MSNNNFVKGECRRCAGHLEFPAAAAGETISCPHCGQPTELVVSVPTGPSRSLRRGWLMLVLLGLAVLSGLAAAILLVKKSGRTAVTEMKNAPAAPSNSLAVAGTVPPVVQNPPGEQRTNDFAISAIKLEKTPGSSLVYVTGKIRNLTNRQRFGVKVELRLLDASDNVVGKATDYQPVLEPNGDWHFKALVMESKAFSARLNSITEDQP